MYKLIIWLISSISILILIYTGYNTIKDTKAVTKISLNNSQPNYQIKNASTKIYNANGKCHCKLKFCSMKYFSNKNISYCIKPIAYIFNADRILIWIIKSDFANLIQNNILSLHDNVEINSATDNSVITSIKTSQLILNLLTQEITSDTKVMIHGINFISVGDKIYSQLNTQKIKLIKNVKLLYEIQK